MIPIRDTVPSRNHPVVNNTLIGVNVVVFLYQLTQGAGADRFFYLYGLVPARYSVPHVAAWFSTGQQLLSLLSFMFLHGGFMHLLGNMWSLYIFGDNVEDRLGPVRYLAFYLACGILSGLSHLLLNIHSNVPTIGASGAIAGVMGAYFLLHPHARILTLIPIIIIPWFVEIPAYFFLGIWFLLQLVNAAGDQGAGGIAWWAHIGGFVFGMLLLRLFDRLPRAGVTGRIRPVTARRRTPRLQVIQPSGPPGESDLYGTIHVSPAEAAAGASKLVNIPWGFQARLVRVSVPAGIREGARLRLAGMGKVNPSGGRGDLLLRVAFETRDD